ncbi:MAG: acyl carrier protein [Dehalococcoidia bacterium]|nr:acyl carrier protein [Dehalococcoidia bacterium]
MASTEDRLRKLISENLEVDGQPISADLDFSTRLIDLGVSSMDLVSFADVIQDEFNVKFTPEHCDELQSLSAVVEYVDANAA